MLSSYFLMPASATKRKQIPQLEGPAAKICNCTGAGGGWGDKAGEKKKESRDNHACAYANFLSLYLMGLLNSLKNLTSFLVPMDNVPLVYQDKLFHIIPHLIVSHTLQNLFSLYLPLFCLFSLCIQTCSSIFILKQNKTITAKSFFNSVSLSYFLIPYHQAF